MTEDEEVNLIMKEIEYYLSFDLLQQEYTAKEIRNALRKIKKSAPLSLTTRGTLKNKVLNKLYLTTF